MKNQIIELITYARQFLYYQLDLRDCPFSGCYMAQQKSCQECSHGNKCNWLNQHDIYSDLAAQSLENLQQSLLLAMHLIRFECLHLDPADLRLQDSKRWLYKVNELFGTINLNNCFYQADQLEAPVIEF